MAGEPADSAHVARALRGGRSRGADQSVPSPGVLPASDGGETGSDGARAAPVEAVLGPPQAGAGTGPAKARAVAVRVGRVPLPGASGCHRPGAPSPPTGALEALGAGPAD